MNNNMRFTCIEPYPRAFLTDRIEGISDLIVEKVEDVQIGLFDQLEEGDFLFIDSSHVLKTGNDVVHLYLKVLPRLKPGVIIHIHDLFLPREYPKKWVLVEEPSWN